MSQDIPGNKAGGPDLGWWVSRRATKKSKGSGESLGGSYQAPGRMRAGGRSGVAGQESSDRPQSVEKVRPVCGNGTVAQLESKEGD